MCKCLPQACNKFVNQVIDFILVIQALCPLCQLAEIISPLGVFKSI